jgi:hypothetical protein
MSNHDKTKETSKQILGNLKKYIDTINEQRSIADTPLLIPSSNDRFLLYTTVVSNSTYYYFFSINNDYSNPYTTDSGIKYNSAVAKLKECVFEGVFFKDTFVLNDILVLNGKTIKLDYTHRHSMLTTLAFADALVVPKLKCEVVPIFKHVEFLKFYKHYNSVTHVLTTGTEAGTFYKKNYQLEATKQTREFKTRQTDYGNIYDIIDPKDDTNHGRVYIEPDTCDTDLITCRFNTKFGKWVLVR